MGEGLTLSVGHADIEVHPRGEGAGGHRAWFLTQTRELLVLRWWLTGKCGEDRPGEVHEDTRGPRKEVWKHPHLKGCGRRLRKRRSSPGRRTGKSVLRKEERREPSVVPDASQRSTAVHPRLHLVTSDLGNVRLSPRDSEGSQAAGVEQMKQGALACCREDWLEM